MPSWFTSNVFKCEQLVEAYELAPHVPTRVRSLKLFRAVPTFRTSVVLEYRDGLVSLVPSATRGSRQGTQVEIGKRHVVPVTIPHFPQYFNVLSDELPDIRAFGTVDGIQTVAAVVAEKLQQAKMNFDLTTENLQLGGLRGIVKDADGSTLLNMFTLFGLTQDSVNMDLGATPDTISDKCNEIIRTMSQNLGGQAIARVHAFVGDDYFDALEKVPEVKEAYIASRRETSEDYNLQSHVYRSIYYKGITFENYRGDFGAESLIDEDEAIFFPIGPDVYRRYNGPADTLDSVGRAGKEIELTRELMPHDTGIEYKAQMNTMYYVTRPKALIKSTATYAA